MFVEEGVQIAVLSTSYAISVETQTRTLFKSLRWHFFLEFLQVDWRNTNPSLNPIHMLLIAAYMQGESERILTEWDGGRYKL